MALAPTKTYVLSRSLPLTVQVTGVPYRIEIVQVDTSKEWRLIAIDETEEAKRSIRFWLLAFAGKKEAIEERLFKNGLTFVRDQGGFAIFERLVSDGLATTLAF